MNLETGRWEALCPVSPSYLVTEEEITSIFLQNIWDEGPNHNKKDFAS